MNFLLLLFNIEHLIPGCQRGPGQGHLPLGREHPDGADCEQQHGDDQQPQREQGQHLQPRHEPRRHRHRLRQHGEGVWQLELETNLREVSNFTITKNVPMAFSWL